MRQSQKPIAVRKKNYYYYYLSLNCFFLGGGVVFVLYKLSYIHKKWNTFFRKWQTIKSLVFSNENNKEKF